MSLQYDIAISYAGEDIVLASLINNFLREMGYRVFFAPCSQQEIIGLDLDRSLYTIYGMASRFVVALVSKNYIKKSDTMLEARIAAARSLDDDFCLLPISIDGALLPDLPPRIAYIKESDAAQISKHLQRIIITRCSVIRPDNQNHGFENNAVSAQYGDRYDIKTLNGNIVTNRGK